MIRPADLPAIAGLDRLQPTQRPLMPRIGRCCSPAVCSDHLSCALDGIRDLADPASESADEATSAKGIAKALFLIRLRWPS